LFSLISALLTVQIEAEDTAKAPKRFYAGDIKKATYEYISSVTSPDGIFKIDDDKTGEILKLKFIKIHDPVRQIDKNIYFACTDFYLVGNPKKIYDIDFWLDHDNSNLKVYRSKVHKEPRWSILYGWYKHPRYTFVNDQIEYLY